MLILEYRETIEYKMIFTDNVTKLVKVYERFSENYQKREKYKIELFEKKEKI